MCKEKLQDFFDRILKDPQYKALWEQAEELNKLVDLCKMLRPKPYFEYYFTYDDNTTDDRYWIPCDDDYTDDSKSSHYTFPTTTAPIHYVWWYDRWIEKNNSKNS